jgi:predicted lipoprotein with Yx(FWY)xxD motif
MRSSIALCATALFGLGVLLTSGTANALHAGSASAGPVDYLPERLPPGFRVIVSEVEGPVFADPNGKTLYTWPTHVLRNGNVGDRKNAPSSCTAEVEKVNSGLMSPYPAGYALPELSTRKSCAQLWPPVFAATDAKPIGKWTLLRRPDGERQWAYDGYPVYTSVLDRQPGDALGGTRRRLLIDAPGVRVPIGPHAAIPPGFAIAEAGTGRMLVKNSGVSVYSWDGDRAGKSNCVGGCLDTWAPVSAPEESRSQGEWTIIERSPGIRQWAFRNHPLYTYIGDTRAHSLRGSDEPGWHNVYVLRAPTWPSQFTQQATHAGIVLADSHGKTIYLYSCGDDALDQLACDHPSTPQEYRLAVCGGGDAARCLKTWPPVIAPRGAKPPSRSWTTIDIDPISGHFAAPGEPGALHVWAYRDRPVYTFAGDKAPGDVKGDAWGEFYGFRNGFKAFWLRDDFFENAG